MNNSYRIAQDFTNQQFKYGGIEETIGFVCDNYYLAIDMYRSIVKAQKEMEEMKVNAHKKLKKLRDDEERWKRTGQEPKGFDAEEHQKRKDHLVELRESEIEILYNEKPIKHDKLGNLIMNNMRVFKELEMLDRNTRKVVGSAAKAATKAILWPTLVLLRIDQDMTKNPKYSTFLDKAMSFIKVLPNEIEDHIVNP